MRIKQVYFYNNSFILRMGRFLKINSINALKFYYYLDLCFRTAVLCRPFIARKQLKRQRWSEWTNVVFTTLNNWWQ